MRWDFLQNNTRTERVQDILNGKKIKNLYRRYNSRFQRFSEDIPKNLKALIDRISFKSFDTRLQ